MEPYLKRLARLFMQQQAAELPHLTFVFPNRRAGLFFRKYLGQAAGRPILAPETITINQCFEMLSGMQPADHLGLLFKLYRIYKAETGTNEAFDKFAYWGNMLLSDFDEIDKYLIPAKQLFGNLSDLKRLDNSFDYLTPAQKEAIERFWNGFDADEKRENRRKFLHAWQHLYPVYQTLQQEMTAEGRAYEGCLQRRVAENAKNGTLETATAGKRFVFIGFNALTPCETALMAFLQKNGQADFYWDNEAPETNDPQNLASRFISENRKRFPSLMELPASVDDGCPHGRNGNINLIPIPSNIGQTTCIHNLLHNLHPAGQPADWTRTAVVLPDENLLMPMLHAIPAHIGQVNVTMGYPLKNTAVFALMEHLYELQQKIRTDKNGKTRFYHRCVLKILQHPYMQALCPEQANRLAHTIVEHNLSYIPQEYFADGSLLETVFSPQQTAGDAIAYVQILLKSLLQQSFEDKNEKNYIYQYYATVNRTRDILEQQEMPGNISVQTLFMLLRELSASVNIPFTGEPLNGLQIMGTLETRGLDFDNLIIASMNEGKFPKSQAGNSFIPYELRRGFGLPTTEQQNAVFAYNFYRLIYRAKNIYFLYDTRTEGLNDGEPSRFIHQLQFQYGCQPNIINISRQPATEETHEIQVEKTPEVQAMLANFTTQDSTSGMRHLSASALNTYLNCPLQFYLLYVKRIGETPQVRETIEADMFGTILHAAMQQIYLPYEGKIIEEGTLTRILGNEQAIDRTINETYTREYLADDSGETIIPEGRDKLIMDVIGKYVRLLLKYDRTLTPFAYVQSECKCMNTISLADGRKVNIKGFIDRVDCKDGMIRIIDYKTGKGDLNFRNIDSLFDRDNPKRPKYALQTFLYAWMYRRQHMPQQPIAPHIYYLKNISTENFQTQICQKESRMPAVPVNDFETYQDDFLQRLTGLLEEIFNPDIAFTQCNNAKQCEHCAFRPICNR